MPDTADPPAPVPPWAPAPAADFIRLLLETGFSPEAYRDHYADLSAQTLNAAQALSHFLLAGLPERRIVPLNLNRGALIALARLPIDDRAFRARLLICLGGHLFDDTGHPYGPAIQDRWPAIRALVAEGARPYFIAGDSHSHQYSLTGARGGAWLLPIHLLCTGGSATALGNPVSRSGYGALLRRAVQIIETLPGAATIPLLLQFGQVDIEFVHHFQRIRGRQFALNLDDYRVFCERTAESYIQFATGLFSDPSRLSVSLVSVFPPVLSDEAWQKGYANADIVFRETNHSAAYVSAAIQTLEIATLRQRTEIHLYYNDLLRSACERHGFGFIDGATPFLGANGIVDPNYVAPEANGSEHHMDGRATHGKAGDLIWQSIDRAAGSDA